jgi:superfamily II DNA or RNA helicase
MTNAITNESATMLGSLSRDFADATSVKLIVSFLMESGARLFVEQVRELAKKNVPIQILTGKYLNITEPSAIYLLKRELGNKIDIRFVKDTNTSFHPKAYFIDKEHESVVYVGSSNLSRSALIHGIEWNFRVERSTHKDDYAIFSDTYQRLFNEAVPVTDEVLRQYAEQWKKTTFNIVETHTHGEEIRPVGAQIEALYYLDEAKKEGAQKGLVIAATGVGKTYLAAFDSKEYSRVLFIAHTREILEQAAHSFHTVRPDSSLGFFTGEEKVRNTDLIFSTVQTIGQERYLTPEYFTPEYFDYIIVDEFHHAAAPSYQKIFQYFTPAFLLGLTATPFRMDNRDIFVLCDDNVVYEIHLQDAINRGILAPFSYFAFYDDTDYTEVPLRSGHYDTKILQRVLSAGRQPELVLAKYRQFGGKKTLAFCAGIQHAEFMAEYFNRQGINAVVVHSGVSSSPCFRERSEAIAGLHSGAIPVVFTVDIFNEGVDVPSIDTVLFLRPTESFVVFLQQLGRGLRKTEGKEKLTVLDFIGNYQRAHHIPMLLAGINPLQSKEGRAIRLPHEIEYPDGCTVNFDFHLIDLFDEMRKHDPVSQRIKEEYWRLKENLGRRPNRLDVYEGIDIPFRYYLNNDGWLRFLDSVGELTAEEKSWLGTPAEELLKTLDKTTMSKSFKMPTLLAFLSVNDELVSTDTLIRPDPFTDTISVADNVTLAQIVSSWKNYYQKPFFERDLLKHTITRNWREWSDDRIARHVLENPVHFLSKSHKQFFRYDETNKKFSLDPALQNFLGSTMANHIKDILAWRTVNYFATRFTKEGE